MSVALIQGASKGIGFSFVKHFLVNTPYQVIATSRSWKAFEESWTKAKLDTSFKDRITFIPMDVTSEEAVSSAAKQVADKFGNKSLRCVINSAGYLLPEKAIRQVDLEKAKEHFMVNTIGPLVFAKYFSGLLAPPEKTPTPGQLSKSVWVNMSARTGSIGDNHLGGWYSYRMSKAALNQLTKTLAVELGRKGSIVVSLHPGTVDTDLSREYTKNVQNKFTPDESVDKLIKVIRSLNEQDNGGFFDYQRKPIPY